MSAWGTWPPSAPPPAAPPPPPAGFTNPLQSANSQLIDVAAPNTAELVPAPSPGFMAVISYVRAQNNSVAATSEITVQDDSGLQWVSTGANALSAKGGGTFPVLNSRSQSNGGNPIWARSALTATVLNGGPCTFYAEWSFVPIGEIVESTILLTSSYQTANVSPVAPGRAMAALARYGRFGILPGTAPLMSVSINNDSATINYVFRVTRGAEVWETSEAGPTQRTRSALIYSMTPTLKFGDVLEYRLQAAPVIPGSVTMRLYYAPVVLDEPP